jgi:hypothetical protein
VLCLSSLSHFFRPSRDIDLEPILQKVLHEVFVSPIIQFFDGRGVEQSGSSSGS